MEPAGGGVDCTPNSAANTMAARKKGDRVMNFRSRIVKASDQAAKSKCLQSVIMPVANVRTRLEQKLLQTHLGPSCPSSTSPGNLLGHPKALLGRYRVPLRPSRASE
eukprot:2463776-Pyramimonas_sp.AAC.1